MTTRHLVLHVLSCLVLDVVSTVTSLLMSCLVSLVFSCRSMSCLLSFMSACLDVVSCLVLACRVYCQLSFAVVSQP